jgi:stage V sporulation protein B
MKKQSTMGGFAILSSAVLIVKILSLIYLPFLNSILGKEGYGIYQAAYLVFVLIFAITTSGLPQAISKIVSELSAVGNLKDAVKAFRMARFILFTTGIIMSIFLYFSAGFLAKESPKSYLAILALSPTIIFATLTSSYRGYFQGRENMIPTAISQVLEQVVNIFFTLLLSYLLLRHGIEAATAGGTFATTIAAVFASIYLIYTYKKNREDKITKFHDPTVERHTNKELFKQIIYYSLPLTIYQGLFYVGNLIDFDISQTRLVHTGFSKPESIAMFGFLTKTTQLIGVPNAIILSLSVAILPAISAAAARKEHKNVKNKIYSSFKICFLISIPSAVGLSVLSSQIFRVMSFGGGANILALGAYILIIMSCVQVFSAILQGLGKLYMVTFFLIFGVVGKIVTNYFLIGIHDINIMGAIGGNVVYYTVPLILDNIILIKILKIKINVFVYAIKPAIASAMMGIILFLSYNVMHKALELVTKNYISCAIPTFIAILLGSYTYFFVMAQIGGIRTNDMNMLPSKLKRILPNSILKRIRD